MIGKTTDSRLAVLIEEYASRLKHYITFEQQVIPELKNVKNVGMEQQKEKEAALILSKIESSEDIILLDERGKHLTSVGFAD